MMVKRCEAGKLTAEALEATSGHKTFHHGG